MGPLIPLFWTSGDVSSGFQSHNGFCLIRAWQSRMRSNLVKLDELGKIYNGGVETLQVQSSEHSLNSIIGFPYGKTFHTFTQNR